MAVNLLPVRRENTAPHRQNAPSWRPFPELDAVHERLDQLFNTLWTEFGRPGGEHVWRPLADLVETDDSYIVEIELPGVRKRDITIDTYDRELVVRGEMKESESGGRFWRRTRPVGHFEHNVVLPSAVDTDSITASLNDGVLRITAPKATAARPRRIEVTAG
ncbi:Hsp20/alpha crystallin family protein [Nocardiopsis rhodophaea]|uniref:Hsp20/alpha crystallin family protein n=1 Tax=Nocardiopsis rhodophaea TaxID=280238 RepID=A0ABP5DQI7_9ACTN